MKEDPRAHGEDPEIMCISSPEWAETMKNVLLVKLIYLENRTLCGKRLACVGELLSARVYVPREKALSTPRLDGSIRISWDFYALGSLVLVCSRDIGLFEDEIPRRNVCIRGKASAPSKYCVENTLSGREARDVRTLLFHCFQLGWPCSDPVNMWTPSQKVQFSTSRAQLIVGTMGKKSFNLALLDYFEWLLKGVSWLGGRRFPCRVNGYVLERFSGQGPPQLCGSTGDPGLRSYCFPGLRYRKHICIVGAGL
jgi:hypothetical protein